MLDFFTCDNILVIFFVTYLLRIGIKIFTDEMTCLGFTSKRYPGWKGAVDEGVDGARLPMA